MKVERPVGAVWLLARSWQLLKAGEGVCYDASVFCDPCTDIPEENPERRTGRAYTL